MILTDHPLGFIPLSAEAAFGAALVNGYAVRRRSLRTYRGGLGPASLRRIKELVHAKMEEALTLSELAESAGLSTAYFSQVCRKSTGGTPHQFVLRLGVERAKEMRSSTRLQDAAAFCSSVSPDLRSESHRIPPGTSILWNDVHSGNFPS